MVELASARVAVRSSDGLVASVAVRHDGTQAGALSAPVDVVADGAAADAILPRSSRHQRVAWSVAVDGVSVPHHSIASWSVVLRRSGLHEWSLVVPQRVDREDGTSEWWPLGAPWSTGSPPPGLGSVAWRGGYLSTTGALIDYPLITDGVADSASLQQQDGAWVLEVSGVGRSGRYQGRTIDASYRQGHGTPRLSVVRALLTRSGCPSADVTMSGGRSMRRPLLLEGEEVWPSAHALCELESVDLVETPSGQWSTVSSLPDGAAPILELTAADLVTGTTSLEFPSDVVTRLVLTATEDVSDGTCERVVTAQTVEAYELTGAGRAAWQIDGGSRPWGLDPVAPVIGDGVQLRIVSRIITSTETVCGQEVARRVETYRRISPEVWRYQVASPGTADAPPDVYGAQHDGAYVAEADASVDGGEAARLWAAPRLALESLEVWRAIYDDDGYRIGEETLRARRGMVEAALKEGPPDSTVGEETWEDVVFIGLRRARGDGRGVWDALGTAPQERVGQSIGGPLIETGVQADEAEIVSHTVIDGYVHRTERRTYGPRRPAGRTYWYSDGMTSSQETETYGLLELERTSYTASGETQSLEVVETLDYSDGGTGRHTGESPVITSRDEYLPAADQLPTTADASTARTLRAECYSARLEASRPRRSVEETVDLAEDQRDLDSLCAQRLRLGAAVEVTMTLPACWPVTHEHRVDLRLPEIGLSRVAVLVDEVEHTQDGGVVLSTITGRMVLL